ncbi:hypothetical protein [Vibrio nitrifigilis]|uniref:Uncharacterized protein n=1 Tax=Vibrio nitrifigilis TaxID=2789781 RepID=A0ABS0GCK5_9VIBR|nr:hypothetical protein [Vibrio nitrifigilis]MBF9000110.1 hypothetical protein [Vibrio nitrifigilis]
MTSKHGVCDWCKRSGLLTKHEYFDGKAYYACHSCDEHARMDIRQYNLEEMAYRQKLAQATPPPAS